MGLALGVVSVAFDSSGAWGAATSLDSYVSVWSMAAYNSSYQIQLAPSEAWGLAFAPAGASDALTLAVAGGSSNRVKIWDVAQAVQKEVATIEMPVPEEKQRKERFTLSVAYSPDGRRLAAGGMDGTVAVFDVATSKLLHTLDGHFRPVRSLTFTPGQQQGDACGKKKERNVTSQCLAWRLMAVTFSAEASHQFSTAVCWPVMLLICVFCSLLQPRHCLLLHTRALHLSRPARPPHPDAEGRCQLPPTHTHFLPVSPTCADSKFVITACDDARSNLYDAEQGALVEAFSGHESWVLSVSAHPDGTAFATGSSDSKVKLWDLHTRTCAQTLGEHEDQVWGVAFRPDGSRLASVGDDKSLCLFDFA